MRVAILHNAISLHASAADRDVLVQVETVTRALERLGHQTHCVAVDLNLDALRRELLRCGPDVVFNLVESLEGCDWLMLLVTGLLDALGMLYTGSPTEAIVLANHKVLAKELLSRADLATPEWFDSRSQSRRNHDLGTAGSTFLPQRRYVLKAVSQHASLGLDDDCVVTAKDQKELERLLAKQTERLGCACFAEEYIEGREFNLSLLADNDGAEVLPAAEIDFAAFPPGKPRIVGYRAKWEEDSFEYRRTPRTFDIPPGEGPLLQSLHTAAAACWELFHLVGYARVDFRVDSEERPWILEVNANPCLSPDAGFAAALAQQAIPFDEAVNRILCSASAASTTT
ncbi:MAG: D-alanine--D-alanine ligase [Planctomycetes bacterium]|nr:D-alanine--D-alanine ligase [Planctomycetota bacterium]